MNGRRFQRDLADPLTQRAEGNVVSGQRLGRLSPRVMVAAAMLGFAALVGTAALIPGTWPGRGLLGGGDTPRDPAQEAASAEPELGRMDTAEDLVGEARR
jgi:hypothetical protein